MTDDVSIKLKSSKAAGAMLGAAYGDALGWPNERIAKSNAQIRTQNRLQDFRRWTRRSGGRFFPHEEVIESGEYSDDTQLILCLCRSLLKGDVWWDHFTQVELPFWSAYERGGGGATKRAVDSWLDGVAPWSPNRKPRDVKKYFAAGGNGVAMRTLPHVIRFAESDFSALASNIFRDGVATHGHPRALLGALAYGFALWTAFRKDSKLSYGELVEELIENVGVWSSVPVSPAVQAEWKSQAEKNFKGYFGLWESAKNDVLEYLEVCRMELSKGALSLDDDVLKKLQCFNTKISGAGTVAAIAAVYLASRHAADPINGVVKAAFALGSDTDTIASMTGGLLGCVNGSDWLSSVKQGIQDATYIEKCALRLANGQVEDKPTVDPVTRSSLKKWTDEVVASHAREIKLLDHRKANLSRGPDQIGVSGKFKVEFRKLTSDDGQSIYITKISKGNFEPSPKSIKATETARQQAKVEGRGCGSKIPVGSFDRSIWFYRDCLGLTIKKQSPEVVVFDQGLVLVPLHYTANFLDNIQLCSILCIQATDIEKRFKRVKEGNIQILSPLAPWGKTEMLFFRSFDPDGNVVEVFSVDNS